MPRGGSACSDRQREPMNILPPASPSPLGLAVATGPRRLPPRTAPAGRCCIVDEQGAIAETVEAMGIADAISAIESSTPATGRLLILLVPVAARACEPPRAGLSML